MQPTNATTGANVLGWMRVSRRLSPEISAMRMSWPVTVVPMFAPMMTPTDCVRVIMPELTRPTQMTTVPAEDWITPVMRVPKMTPLTEEIIRLGQELLQKPVTLLDGVEDVLLQLQGKYKLVLATKGDLFDQKRKVMDSGLVRYFYHIEIMSDKKEADYQKLLNTVGCAPQNFLMLGNSIKSDILPILNLGGYAAHIPYHITWQYENHEGNVTHPNLLQLKNIKDIIGYLL